MLKTREIPISGLVRCLLGVFGFLVLVLSLALMVKEVWLAFHGQWLRLLTAGLLLVVVAGGASLVRSAVRGRLSVRSYHSR
jgi:hypothetical protein